MYVWVGTSDIYLGTRYRLWSSSIFRRGPDINDKHNGKNQKNIGMYICIYTHTIVYSQICITATNHSYKRTNNYVCMYRMYIRLYYKISKAFQNDRRLSGITAQYISSTSPNMCTPQTHLYIFIYAQTSTRLYMDVHVNVFII